MSFDFGQAPAMEITGREGTLDCLAGMYFKMKIKLKPETINEKLGAHVLQTSHLLPIAQIGPLLEEFLLFIKSSTTNITYKLLHPLAFMNFGMP